MLSMHTEETLGAAGDGCRRARLHAEERHRSGVVTAIRRVAEGETVLDPQIERTGNLKGEREQGLTPRELEILQLIVEGKSNKEIAIAIEAERQHHSGTSRQYHGCAGNPQDGGASGLRHS